MIIMIVSVVFLLVVCLVSIVRCFLDLDLDMDVVKIEFEWQFIDGDIDIFIVNVMVLVLVFLVILFGKMIMLVNGDFEMINSIVVNDIIFVSMSGIDILNWSLGGVGVQILVSNIYKMVVDLFLSKYCIYLNNLGVFVNGM